MRVIDAHGDEYHTTNLLVNTNLQVQELWVVANVQNTLQKDNELSNANQEEFFTREEFSFLNTNLNNVVSYIRNFYSEIELISYVINNRLNIDYDKVIVFNFSRNGEFEGKKSLIPAFCEMFRLKHTTSNPFVISLLRNKYVWLNTLKGLGYQTLETHYVSRHNKIHQEQLTKDTYIKKEVCESASIGMSLDCVLGRQDAAKLLSNHIDKAFILQEYVDGLEYEVFVFHFKGNYYAFEPVQINSQSSILTSEISDNCLYELAVSKDQCVNKTLQQTTCKLARDLNITHFARFDFRINEQGQYLIDIAGTPYLTKHSTPNTLFIQNNKTPEELFKLLLTVVEDNYSGE